MSENSEDALLALLGLEHGELLQVIRCDELFALQFWLVLGLEKVSSLLVLQSEAVERLGQELVLDLQTSHIKVFALRILPLRPKFAKIRAWVDVKS